MVENSQNISEHRLEAGKQGRSGRRHYRFGIGFRFISLILVVGVLSGGTVGFVVTNTSRDYLYDEALKYNLVSADLVASFISSYMEVIQAHIKVFANRPDVRQAVVNKTAAQVQPVLEQFVQIQTPLNGAGIYDMKGIQLAYSDPSSTTVGQSFADRDWFQQVIATQKPYQGIPRKSAGTAIPVAPYAVPILDVKGQIIYVLSAGISLKNLSSVMVGDNVKTNTHVSLVDNRNGGLIVTHTDPQRILTPVSGKNEAVGRALAGEHGTMEIMSSSGELDLIGFAQVPGLPWSIMVISPKESALTVVDTMTQDATVYTVLVIVIACILGVVLILGITRPLKSLIKASNAISRGNLNYKIEKVTNDEIGDVFLSFNHMVDEINSVKIDLEKERDNLSFRVQERTGELVKTNQMLLNEISERKQAEVTRIRVLHVKDTINHLLQDTLLCQTDTESVIICLKYMQILTNSKFGWVGELNPEYRLDIIALSDPGWDACRMPETQAIKLIKNMEIRGIWSRVLKDGRTLITAEPATHSDRVGLPDGHPVLTTFMGVPILSNNKVIGMIALANKPSGYSKDDQEAIEELAPACLQVLLRSRAVHEINSLNTTLETRVLERTAQLEAANKELESFSYSVSHDLRSPLRGIDGWSLALLEEYKDKLDEKGHEYLRRVRSETHHMGRLIDDLLLFSRQSRSEMELSQVDMTALVQTIVSRLQQTYSGRPIEFIIQPGIRAQGDAHLMEIALFNLLDNAVKFSSKNSHARIEFGETEGDGNRVFFVRDNGVGFDMAYLHKLFGVFQRLHKLAEFPGTGIGLATVQRIVNRHGGRIWAEAQENQGATFYFILKEAA